MSIEKITTESMDITISGVDDSQLQMKEKLRNIFPESSELPIKEFSGDYKNFLDNWQPAPASKNQFLAIAVKNIGINTEDIKSFIKVLEENNIKIKNKTDFIDNYVLGWSDVIMPLMLSSIIEGDYNSYIYLSGEFMFNKIKEHLL